MRRSSCVSVILLLGLGIVPAALTAQQPGSSPGNRGAPSSKLGQNYPNPFNPTTKIPFRVDESDLVGGVARVTIRIFNVLQQFIAYPDALDSAESSGGGQGPSVNNLTVRDTEWHTAYWDGLDRNGRQVASGLYYVQLIINGRTQGISKALVGK